MINVEGAALIAQVYPVGVVLLVLESGRLRPRKPIDTTFRAVRFAFMGFVQMAALIGALVSVALSVIAVVEERPLQVWETIVVVLSGLALFAFSVNFAGEVLVDTVYAKLETSPWADERRRLRHEREHASKAKRKRKKKRKKPVI